ncbi:MAG TPA: response regulator [Longimicrobiaceae bacterium]|nr:response regulator [Longimicrobiaceae bacterium]
MSSERRRILVVEDSPMMCRMYRLVLGAENDVRFAANGVEGLDLAAQEPDVDLLIVDINMPHMDGLEFVRRLRTELGMTRPAVLVSSTESGEEDRRLAREAGADAFLAKPWTAEELRRAVRERTGQGG